MKTSTFFRSLMILLLSGGFFMCNGYAQTRQKIAIVSIDTKDLMLDKESIRNIVSLELEKTNMYEVLDKYDVNDLVKKNAIDVEGCYGKTCLVQLGKLLKADKMLTGSMERFGDKLIVILRMLDVSSGNFEKSDVTEYINQQEQMQIMIRMSVNNILGIQNDKLLVDLLVNYDQPITSYKTTLKLNGPRVGATYTWGKWADRMQAAESEGGFNMYPVSCMIGYQFEKQFLSSGDFQALFEVIPSLHGMESGLIVPSIAGMLGFRFNKSGIEFGLGPVLRVVTMAEGYYDSNGKFNLAKDLDPNSTIKTSKTLDSRGDATITNSMVFAVGKTFRSGYLNLPVNVYYSPRKDGSLIGLVLGFNVAKRPAFKK